MAEGHHLVGQLLPYDAGKSTWAEWIEVLENFVELNETTDEAQKRAFLITSCGMPTYQLIRNLVQPAKSKDKTFKELVEAVQITKSHNPVSLLSALGLIPECARTVRVYRIT